MLPHIVALLTIFGLAHNVAMSTGTKRQQVITTLSTAEIEVFKPYILYAAVAYCQPSITFSWSCGGLFSGRSLLLLKKFELIFTNTQEKCMGNPDFQPYASGGDGSIVQFCLWLCISRLFATRRANRWTEQGTLGGIPL